eukprot:4419822-Amphidinium_carterae.1
MHQRQGVRMDIVTVQALPLVEVVKSISLNKESNNLSLSRRHAYIGCVGSRLNKQLSWVLMCCVYSKYLGKLGLSLFLVSTCEAVSSFVPTSASSGMHRKSIR